MSKESIQISAALAVGLIVLLWVLFRDLVLTALRWGAILIGVGMGVAFVALIGRWTGWSVIPTVLACTIVVVLGIAQHLRWNKNKKD